MPTRHLGSTAVALQRETPSADTTSISADNSPLNHYREEDEDAIDDTRALTHKTRPRTTTTERIEQGTAVANSAPSIPTKTVHSFIGKLTDSHLLAVELLGLLGTPKRTRP